VRNAKLVFYYVCRALGLFRVAQWLTRNHLKILCYHGFEMKDESAFRPKLFITPDLFERRLATIQRYGLRVLTLDEAVERLYAYRLPQNSVVITIDDGFYSVHEKAVPRLKRFGFPATVYVTSYYVEKPNPVFRLVIQYMFASTACREVVLCDVRWSADRTINLNSPSEAARAMWECINFGERQCNEEERVAISERLGELLDCPYVEIVESKAFNLMTPAQLQSLASGGVAAELHTHRHVLAPDDRGAAQNEISQNRDLLTQWTGSAANHFCYPSGLWEECQWKWLDEMRVKSSTTCLPGLNSAATPRHALRRFLDGQNIHQLEFEASLSGFADMLRGGLWRSH
jgi:peptidoglycan/xylan/chitin deacetylase (PgdA/CDA1 family)